MGKYLLIGVNMTKTTSPGGHVLVMLNTFGLGN